MTSLKVAASKTWSVVSRVRDCFGPSSVPFGELTVVVASTARTSSRLMPIAAATAGLI